MNSDTISTQLRIRARSRDRAVEQACLSAGLSPLQARVVAGRVSSLDAPPQQIVRPKLADLNDPSLLADSGPASSRLARAVSDHEVIGILTDYDVDGITSHAIVHVALTEYFGVPTGLVQHHIGHRIEDGYGVSDALADRILQQEVLPGVIVTADCGSSDQARLERLANAGIDIIVTDHHEIPATGIPDAALAVVNPTRADCAFPDRTVAGCMVSWMLMCETRRRLMESGKLDADAPRLAALLDFVALGTVADAVSLFGPSNRAVVLRGLKEMNRMRRPCWRALAELLVRETGFTVQDLGFQIGPRINARGRMADPQAALRFVLAGDDAEARRHLLQLDADNQDRRNTERDMLGKALAIASRQLASGQCVVVVHDPSFHAGVQGIVASRLVERFGCPAVVLSPSREPGQLSGSARSVKGLDIRAALQDLDDADASLLIRFGGHVGAAGLTVEQARLDDFTEQLDARIKRELSVQALGPELLTDGDLSQAQMDRETISELELLAPYGREFDPPVFEGRFRLQRLRRVGGDGTHLAMELVEGQRSLRGIWFRAMENRAAPLPVSEGQSVRVAYRLERDDYRGGEAVQLHVAGVEVDLID